MNDRRTFLKNAALGAAAGLTFGMTAKSYARIVGANDRISVALMGCGRRVPAFYPVLKDRAQNIDVAYICDVMKKQREKTAQALQGQVTGKAALINDIREALADPGVDAVFNATPDHWHAPGAWMAMEAGKHVYLEKPCSHNLREDELLVAFQKKYGKHVQMGVQQRSSPQSIEIVAQIHEGVIGHVYEAVAYYHNNRGPVPVATPAPVPEGLDWDLFQGPAPRKPYTHDTWDYNWHWYGWDYGTAETGNNATHELDIARWALGVDHPESVEVDAAKRHFVDDGWTMYDTMNATFRYEGNRVIRWDGKCRNSYQTYANGPGRGTILYGTEGTVFVDRRGYKLFDRGGKMIRENLGGSTASGTALGGGDTMTDRHMVNFFNVIRGRETKLACSIEVGVVSQALTHYANIASRIGKGFRVDPATGRIRDAAAMKLWGREYARGWEPKKV